jgi:hypothetical protein
MIKLELVTSVAKVASSCLFHETQQFFELSLRFLKFVELVGSLIPFSNTWNLQLFDSEIFLN